MGWALTWKHLWQQLLAGERSKTAPGEGKSRDGPERMGVADVGLSNEALHAKFGFWKLPTVPSAEPTGVPEAGPSWPPRVGRGFTVKTWGFLTAFQAEPSGCPTEVPFQVFLMLN